MAAMAGASGEAAAAGPAGPPPIGWHDLSDGLQDRVLNALGGWLLLAAPTCRRLAVHARKARRRTGDNRHEVDSLSLLPLPVAEQDVQLPDGRIERQRVSTVLLFANREVATIMHKSPLSLGGGQSRWTLANMSKLPTTIVHEDMEPTILRREGHPWGDGALQGHWSLFRAEVSLPIDASFSFELRLGACTGDETKITLMGDVVLRKAPPERWNASDHADSNTWYWCLWNPGYVDLVPSRITDSDGIWHVITQLVTKEGVTVFEDGHKIFERRSGRPAKVVCRTPDLSLSHLTQGADLRVDMRKPCVILPANTAFS